MKTVKINKDTCKGCELCITVCKSRLIIMTDEYNSRGLHYAVFFDKEEQCTGCGLCAIICPDAAVEIKEKRGAHAKS